MSRWQAVPRRMVWLGAGSLLLSSCAGGQHYQPQNGSIPATAPLADVQSTIILTAAPADPAPRSAISDRQPQSDKRAFDLPAGLPGAGVPQVQPPRFKPETPVAEREKAIQATYPQLPPVPESLIGLTPRSGTPLTLADLQRIAGESSPVLRRARAEADASYGTVIQAGLYPNPTTGYQADQVQPGNKPSNNPGQQGAFLNQLVKFPGKLSLAQAVAGFDYLNALVAVRAAQVDVMTQVRANYFAVLVAEKSMEVNRALVTLADEVYRLQLKQLAVGEAAGYEPLQLYAQAVQARNALVRAENTHRAAWKQLAAAVGQPALPPAPLVGQADAPAPAFEPRQSETRVLEQHTDLLTARNALEQARVNLQLQQRLPYPDLATNTVVQYDYVSRNNQFNLQLGIQLPVFDRNQGNIHQAVARIGRAQDNYVATQNDLLGRLAEAFSRYDANRVVTANYRDQVIPSLTGAYRTLVRRYQAEPEKVGFNDIVVAQQNLAQALQNYLAALEAQWRAVVDLANLTQQDELYWNACPEPVVLAP